MNPAKTTPGTIVEEITINAPIDRVFDAFILERADWWHVEGRFHTTRADSDLRPGGAWIMRGTRPDGSAFTIKGTYRTVDRPRLLVFTWLPSWQEDATESEVRVDFIDEDGKTRVRLTHSGLSTEKLRQSHRGWPQLLKLLAAHVTP